MQRVLTGFNCKIKSFLIRAFTESKKTRNVLSISKALSSYCLGVGAIRLLLALPFLPAASCIGNSLSFSFTFISNTDFCSCFFCDPVCTLVFSQDPRRCNFPQLQRSVPSSVRTLRDLWWNRFASSWSWVLPQLPCAPWRINTFLFWFLFFFFIFFWGFPAVSFDKQ